MAEPDNDVEVEQLIDVDEQSTPAPAPAPTVPVVPNWNDPNNPYLRTTQQLAEELHTQTMAGKFVNLLATTESELAAKDNAFIEAKLREIDLLGREKGAEPEVIEEAKERARQELSKRLADERVSSLKRMFPGIDKASQQPQYPEQYDADGVPTDPNLRSLFTAGIVARLAQQFDITNSEVNTVLASVGNNLQDPRLVVGALLGYAGSKAKTSTQSKKGVNTPGTIETVTPGSTGATGVVWEKAKASDLWSQVKFK